MTSVPAYGVWAATELLRTTAEWASQWREKLLAWDAHKLGYIQNFVSETATSVTYERSAVKEKEEELWIEHNSAHEIHMHPNWSVYPSGTDIQNRTQQYIDSNWMRSEFRIVVRDPKLGVNIVVAYDHLWNVRKQRVWDQEYDLIMIWSDKTSRGMLRNVSEHALKHINLAVDRYKIWAALIDALGDWSKQDTLVRDLKKDFWHTQWDQQKEYAADIHRLKKDLLSSDWNSLNNFDFSSN